MDDPAEMYNLHAEEYALSRIGAEDKAELNKFKNMLSPGDKVLDVGCAAGRDSRILKDMGFNAVGSDLADKLLEIARRQNPDIEFVHADMRQLPFKNGSFNAIWASAVIHHIVLSEMPHVIREFKRVLKPDGLLYIHTKAGKGKLLSSEQSVHGEKREFELLKAEDLDKLLVSSGFRKVELYMKASKSRKGLFWVTAYYRS